ncbi:MULTISPECIES: flagellar transcriptional regulator FlhD [Pandoraea]|uniref:Transcriptional regulator n=2 Tax=Pandoraea TaxID=93217 RepID=A0A5E4XDV5_9BURK|nr:MULTISPECIES: flagellar transcriptional regulator FlhD [Pandoraea]VVE16797.1 transcriptional regulator [Pandoraea cepalis]VVE34611.1 transcriptional regulator [Pandoraea terrigena]
MLQNSTILGEIYRLNLAYLTMLHRNLLADFATAVDTFGLSEEIAAAIVNSKPDKLARLARTPQLLLRVRFNDVQFLRTLAAKVGPGIAQKIESEEASSA